MNKEDGIDALLRLVKVLEDRDVESVNGDVSLTEPNEKGEQELVIRLTVRGWAYNLWDLPNRLST